MFFTIRLKILLAILSFHSTLVAWKVTWAFRLGTQTLIPLPAAAAETWRFPSMTSSICAIDTEGKAVNSKKKETATAAVAAAKEEGEGEEGEIVVKSMVALTENGYSWFVGIM
jgi:hypothetical protein